MQKTDFLKSLEINDIFSYIYESNINSISSGFFVAIVIDKFKRGIKIKEIYGNGDLFEYEIIFESISLKEYANLTYIGNINFSDIEKIKSKFPEYFI